MSAPSSSNNNGETAPKHARADRANETRLWKSRKANHAFQLSHSRDYYGLYNLLRDTDFEGKVTRSLICGPFKGVLQQFAGLIDRSVTVIAGLNC